MSGEVKMKIVAEPRVREAVTTAVRGAIVAVGGIAGLRQMSMFQSSERATTLKQAA